MMVKWNICCRVLSTVVPDEPTVASRGQPVPAELAVLHPAGGAALPAATGLAVLLVQPALPLPHRPAAVAPAAHLPQDGVLPPRARGQVRRAARDGLVTRGGGLREGHPSGTPPGALGAGAAVAARGAAPLLRQGLPRPPGGRGRDAPPRLVTGDR